MIGGTCKVRSVTITPELGRRGLPPIRALGGSSENLLWGVDPGVFQAAIQQAVRHYSLNAGMNISDKMICWILNMLKMFFSNLI
jgi:hypothetical protein